MEKAQSLAEELQEKLAAKASADLNMACAFFRIKHQEGVGFVDGHSMPLSKWSKNANISEFESSAEEAAEANDDWLISKTLQLHDEKALKEDKVQELMNENVRLQSLVDQKEAQLVALNEQLKLTSLSERDK
ncbi:hypothetical protein ACMD2_02357 [Ananas comosus]|uniref:Uncharacterized protein n=1 Tax=Ananas comosus TaxID=4615 RepID=A0A199VCP0_ANACO|nr:hypothetical protein ACMD2_02357 [Ananas comosus]